jgi:hypothetical protein
MHDPEDESKVECTCMWAFEDEGGGTVIVDTDQECPKHGNREENND